MLEIAAGQFRLRRPGWFHLRKEGPQPGKRMFGKAAEGCDLASEDGERRRLARRCVEIENIVPGHGRGIARAIVEKRADAGITPNHIGWTNGFAEIAADALAKVIDLSAARPDFARIAFKGTSVVPINVKRPSNGIANTMRLSSFWKMKAWSPA